jgi:AraC-like DNA-binding protein
LTISAREEPSVIHTHGSPAIRKCPGHERLAARAKLDRHRHSESYVAVVLEGGYRESGDMGRFRVSAGDALVHGRFEAHANDAAAIGARILNLPVDRTARAGLFRVRDPDFLVRVASHDIAEAVAAFVEDATPQVADAEDWPDLLAAELRALSALRLGSWARSHGLAPETVARAFARAYGVTPHRYRSEARARAAYATIVAGKSRLSEVAAELGFADQPHMTRALRAVTGRTPGYWRRRGCEPR